MAPRRKRSNLSQRQIRYKKRAITRKVKRHKVKVVTRKGQPIQDLEIEVPKLKKQDIGGRVASSWIANIIWHEKRNHAVMSLIKNHRVYDVFIPFKVFEQWYWAHSKGTFFNGNIKGKYRVERVA